MSDTLARFHEVLVREIRKSRPEYLDEPFTVAEIYQNLVPYRTHRDALGVEMNGDYEHALLRLLGGEGDFLQLDSEVARRQIREELEQPNPNTGLFRDFAAADVRLTDAHRGVGPAGDSADQGDTRDLADLLTEAEDTAATQSAEEIADVSAYAPDTADEDTPAMEETEFPDSAVTADGATDEEEPAETDDDAPRRLFVMAGGDEDEAHHEDTLEAEFEPEDPTVHAFGGDEDPEDHVDRSGVPAAHGLSGAESGESESCHWCRAELPARNVLNFCPFCGSNLGMKPCAECGEELDAGWMFCPACGTEAAR